MGSSKKGPYNSTGFSWCVRNPSSTLEVELNIALLEEGVVNEDKEHVHNSHLSNEKKYSRSSNLAKLCKIVEETLNE